MASLGRRLLHIEVAVLAYLDDSPVSFVHRHTSALYAPPGIYHGRTVITGIGDDYLVPSGHLLAELVDDVLDLVHEPAVKFLGTVQTILLNQSLAVRTVVPGGVIHLIASDVDVLRGEKRRYLLEYVGENLIVLHSGHTEDVVSLSVGADIGHVHRAGHLRKDAHQGAAVSGQVYLRDDLDMALGSVFHDLAYLLLSIISAVAVMTLTVGGRTHLIIAPPCALLCQLRILADLNPPAVVIGQMPVETVELMVGHPVYETEHMVHIVECSGHIQHRTAIAVPGSIFHDHGVQLIAGQLHIRLTVHCRRHHLQECLYAIKDTGGVRCLDDDL